jgi:Flp pilus assembly pilin Flp
MIQGGRQGVVAHACLGGLSMHENLHIMLRARITKLDGRGATTAEYGLLVVGIVFVLAGVLANASSMCIVGTC